MEKLLSVAVMSEISLHDFYRRFALVEKSVPLVVIKFFITISLLLKRIVGFIFRRKWKIQTVFFSKLIIGFHYEELLQILYDHLNFTLIKNVLHYEKVSIRNSFVSRVLGKSRLFPPVMHQYIKETSFYSSG